MKTQKEIVAIKIIVKKKLVTSKFFSNEKTVVGYLDIYGVFGDGTTKRLSYRGGTAIEAGDRLDITWGKVTDAARETLEFI